MTGRHWGYSPLGRGRINGHVSNRENRRHQDRENRSAHLAMIGALVSIILLVCLCLAQPLLFNPGTPHVCAVSRSVRLISVQDIQRYLRSQRQCVSDDRMSESEEGYVRGTRADNAVKLDRDSASLSC